MDVLEIRGIKYFPLKKIGKGSFGVVYEVEHQGKRKALKVIEDQPKEGVKSLKELDILSRLRHPGLAHADEIISEYRPELDKIETFIVMPLAQSDLHKAIYDKSFSYGEKIKVLTDVTKGLSFLHDQQYLHMDIKPLNILVFNNYQKGKLSDFGLSLRLEDGYKRFPISLMTIDHRSINILLGSRKYTFADDIWSLGITFFETFTGKSPFSHLKKKEYTKERVIEIIKDVFSPEKIDKTLASYMKRVPILFKNKLTILIKQMLSFDPKDRPTADQVLTQLTRDTRVGGEVLFTPILPPSICDALILEGFHAIVKLCSKIWAKLETFFLAADIYQRSLAYRHPLTGDLNQDINNSIFQGVLSVFMAIKVIETFGSHPEKLVELTNNRFPEEDLIIGEAHLITGFGGQIYPNNLFTASTTIERFQLAFEVSRNCHFYRDIDINEWKELDLEEREEGAEIYKGKWGFFVDFLETSDYADVIYADSSIDLNEIYESDKKFD